MRTAGSQSHRITQAEGGCQRCSLWRLLPPFAICKLTFAPTKMPWRSWMMHTPSPRRAGSAPPQPRRDTRVEQRRSPAGRHPFACPTKETWVGDRALDPARRGIVALGASLGLPALADTQVAWLLLSFCAAPRAQYALRSLAAQDTRANAAGHDAAVLACLDALLYADEAVGLAALAAARAQLALRHGRLCFFFLVCAAQSAMQ